MNVLIILLGCHIINILQDRIETAVELATSIGASAPCQNNSDLDPTSITWFLSGGVKDPLNNPSGISEAEKMSNTINKLNVSSPNSCNRSVEWSYIYDTVSKNTADNFIAVKRELDKRSAEYDDIYVVTSAFHFDRANRMVGYILRSHADNIKWRLAPQEETDSRYWEKIHLKNVDSDIQKSIIGAGIGHEWIIG